MSAVAPYAPPTNAQTPQARPQPAPISAAAIAQQQAQAHAHVQAQIQAQFQAQQLARQRMLSLNQATLAVSQQQQQIHHQQQQDQLQPQHSPPHSHPQQLHSQQQSQQQSQPQQHRQQAQAAARAAAAAAAAAMIGTGPGPGTGPGTGPNPSSAGPTGGAIGSPLPMTPPGAPNTGIFGGSGAMYMGLLGNNGSSATSTSPRVISGTQTIQMAPNRIMIPNQIPRTLPGAIGGTAVGNAVLKLLQYGEHLGTGPEKLDINFWRKFISDFYAENGFMRLSLWNVALKETKTFEITTTTLPTFYLNNFESGVQQINLVLENAREYIMQNNSQYVECPRASWVYNFDNGCRVVSNGYLRVVFTITGKIELLEFVTRSHNEYIARKAIVKTMNEDHKPPIKKAKMPTSFESIRLPDSPVNEYGITQKVLRCLEISESVNLMRDLMSWSLSHNHGPLESLRKFTEAIRNMPQPSPRLGMPMVASLSQSQGGMNMDMNSPGSPMLKRRLSMNTSGLGSPADIKLQASDLAANMNMNNPGTSLAIKPSPSPRISQRSPSQSRKKQ